MGDSIDRPSVVRDGSPNPRNSFSSIETGFPKNPDPGHFWLGSPKLRLHSLVRQFQVVQVDLVRILFEIAVHLKIHGDSIPARAWAILKRPIQGRGLPV